MTITYFLMLLFVFWTACELRYFSMNLQCKGRLSGWSLVECTVYGALATYFFHNIW